MRSTAPAGIDREGHALVERLEDLVDRGAVADLSVRSWGSEVALSRTAVDARGSRVVLERVAAFRSWAAETGRSLTPYFATREGESTITGERYALQVLPVRALVEYRGDEVAHVAPCTRPDGEAVGVVDRIERLERAAPGPERLDGDPATVARGSER